MGLIKIDFLYEVIQKINLADSIRYEQIIQIHLEIYGENAGFINSDIFASQENFQRIF